MTFEKIAEIISENIGCDVSEITEKTTFEDLNIDSLDIAEVAMAIEEEFGLENFEASPSMKTVGDLVEAVENAMS